MLSVGAYPPLISFQQSEGSVYITIDKHPEDMLFDLTIKKQVHFSSKMPLDLEISSFGGMYLYDM